MDKKIMRLKISIPIIFFILYGLSISGCEKQTGPNVLLQAVKDKDLAEVKKLLANPDVVSHDLNPKCPGAICEPIFFAARGGSLKIMELLIDAGADINNQSGKSGDTPLIIASYMNNYELARLLIQKGADVNKANHFGATPFWGACFMGNYELVKLFINTAEINFPGRFPDVLKKKGEKKQFVEKITPLMAASTVDNIEIVRLLIQKGADIKLKDSLGRSAVDYATKFNHRKIKFFLQKEMNEKISQ
jgi:ankyrin repeat protein